MEDTRRALMRMGSLKAPGPDGFQSVFFKETWELTEKALHKFTRDIIEGGNIPSEAAEILLVLIPIEERPSSIRNFRPVSLCNVTVKVISRMIVDRLKAMLCEVISHNQASFVPGRQSCGNFIICQEVAHSLKYIKAKHGGMILKLDLEKAYDRLEWNFVQESLIDASVPWKLVSVILNILQRSTCKLLWNGETTETFKLARGLRQGDPLSPYIFVICMERFSRWIHKEVKSGRWRLLKASRGGASVSHLFFADLFFADDILLFPEATDGQVDCILNGINRFCRASGQKINFNKSSVFFSTNVPNAEALRLSSKLGIRPTLELGTYLGHKVHHQGRSNRANNLLLEKVRGRLDGWKIKSLSLAGRLTLAKSVINSMGVFQMQVHRLPASVHKELDKYVRRCVWGELESVKKTHLINWEVLCKPKVEGGFGMRKAEGMNKALLAKLGWRLLTQGEEMWAKILRVKYGIGDSGPPVFRREERASPTWRGLEWAANLLHEGIKWKVVDGRKVRFWSDNWLGDRPLKEACPDMMSEEEEKLTVRDLWVEGSG